MKIEDKLTGLNARSVYLHTRKVGDSVRHLIVNTDEKREVQARIRIPEAGTVVAAFDMATGRVYKLALAHDSFDVTIFPAGSLLIIVNEDVSAADTVPA